MKISLCGNTENNSELLHNPIDLSIIVYYYSLRPALLCSRRFHGSMNSTSIRPETPNTPLITSSTGPHTSGLRFFINELPPLPGPPEFVERGGRVLVGDGAAVSWLVGVGEMVGLSVGVGVGEAPLIRMGVCVRSAPVSASFARMVAGEAFKFVGR